MEKAYAQAIEALRNRPGADDKKIVSDLVKHLTATGRTKLLPRILRELKVLEARREKLAPTVEAASEAEAKHALAEAKAAGIDAPKAHVNHDLIKGWRARSGGSLIDRSAKQGLVEMYRRITG